MSAVVPASSPEQAGAVEATRLRLLDATLTELSRLGMRKLNMSAVAACAGVSRPTLYRYFPSKETLLRALAEHQQRRFETGVAAAIRGAVRGDQLDAVLRFIVQFQVDDQSRRLVEIEPAFVLDRLARLLPAQRASLARLLTETIEQTPVGSRPGWQPDDVADVIVRTALSYFLIPGGDENQLLRALRSVLQIASGERRSE
ncbi:MAG: TetR/AcrR family transcriptional regulator [Acidimicrobiales bacterium]